MNVQEIIKKYLDDHGLDGLCDPNGDCACFRDDLVPCGQDPCLCKVGRRVLVGMDGETVIGILPVEDDADA